ncbi:hypothetical protein [Streptomyces sp. NPDC057428]|uniref:hypothetical protein n=1 Tax=Streptomyces sp. NPDC057428 TaxID=3346129 RepID=UPI00368C4807
MTTLNFVLQGRDALSRTLNGAGDAADRMRRRLDDAAANSARAIAGFTRDADGALRDLQGNLISTDDAVRRLRQGATDTSFANVTESARKFGDQLKSSLISLAPAAIPAVAGLAGAAAAVGAQLGAAGVAAGAYALALGPQIGAITEAREAHKKYETAVEESGRTSTEAAEAQAAYQRKLSALPPETRKAAVAVGLLSDNFSDWSDSLSGDVMGPFTKGVAVTNALLPRTTGLVRGTSAQFDRLITLAGAGVSSPGFDRLNDRFTTFANDTMRDAVDGVVRFFDQLDSGEISDSGLQEFFEYCQENGPVVKDTLHNVGEAALNIIEAGSGVGVGMLDLINALSGIVAAVPPGAISALLQMAIAIKAVRLAAAGGAAASAALGALAGQIVLMRTAAAGTPGRLAGVGAAITTLSRTAKLAIAGTGIGLLLIGLSQLSQRGKDTPPDVDKLTTSLGRLGQSGKVSGEALKAFGPNLDGLTESIRTLADPSTTQQIEKFFSDLLGYGEGGPGLKKAAEDVDAVDKALANLVSGGKADLAAAALDEYTKRAGMSSAEVAELRGQLGDYTEALSASAFEQQLAAESAGLFGAQAQQVQAQLDAQKQSADGLSQSIHALNNAYLEARGGVRGMEAAIDAASESFKRNGRTLDENTEKGRANNQSLDDLAAATMKAAEAARANGESWDTVSGIQDRGRQAFIRSAMQMGKNEQQAKALADQILRTPDKTAYLKGDLADLRAKLADAKERLRKSPSSKTAKLKGEISDLQRKIAQAEGRLRSFDGSRATAYIDVISRYINPTPGPYAGQYVFAEGGPIRRAEGGPIPGFPGGGRLRGPGTSTSDSILLWGSTGEYMVKASSVEKYGEKFMDQVNAGTLPVGHAAPPPGRPAATSSAGPTMPDRPQVTYNLYPRASVISVEDLRLVQRQEEARQRVGRPR